MKMYDVAVIGAGVVGTAIARELSRYRLTVVVFEKEIELAFGVSKSNSGIIHPGTQHSPDSLKGRLCLQGNILTGKLAAELGIDFKRVGELIVAFNDEELRRLAELKKDADALGVPGTQIVDKMWLKKNEPNLSDAAVGALYAPTAGIISPYRWVYNIAESAARNGVEIKTSEKVTAITRNAGGFELASQSGKYRARFVVNAAGLYADEVSQMAGVDTFTIKPRKGEEFLLDKKTAHLTRHLLFPLPNRTSKGILVTRTSDGNPMIGPTADDVSGKEDLSTTEEGLRKVLEGAKRLVPKIEERDIIAYFAGLRPVAGEDFIIRHEEKAPGFINVAGIQSPGLTAAPAIAVMAAGILKEAGLKMKRKLFFRKGLSGGCGCRGRSRFDIVCRCETVSAGEVRRAIALGARTMDGIKFRTRAQAGRCHGSFCTPRVMKLLSEGTGEPFEKITKRGAGSEIIMEDRAGG